MAFPTTRNPGDLVLSADWNDTINAIVGKVNKAGDSMTGPLTIQGALRVNDGNNKAVVLLTNMGPGNWNPLTQNGDHMLLWTGTAIDDPRAGLVIAPWRNDASGIRIDANGSVGIGTPSWIRRLHVHSDDWNSAAEIHASGATAGFSFTDREPGRTWDNGNAGERWVWYSQDRNAKLWTSGLGDLLTIKSDGNVGIGTTEPPKAKLQVSGGAIMPAAGKDETAGIFFPKDPGGGGGDAAWIRYYPREGEATTFEIGTSNDADDHIALMASGGVGIGTKTPGAKLHVAAGTIDIMRVVGWAPTFDEGLLLRLGPQSADKEGGHLELKGAGDYRDWVMDTYEGNLRFFEPQQSRTATKKRGGIVFRGNRSTTDVPDLFTAMFINSDGNVGIGTATPGGKLHISGGSFSQQQFPNANAALEIDNSGDQKAILQANGPWAPYRITIQDGHGRVSHLWNAYDAGDTHKYDVSNEKANWFQMNEGQYALHSAPAGTKGSDIEWKLGLFQNVDGHVGIGTANPGAPFHLLSSASPTAMRIQSTSSPGVARIAFWSDPQGSTNEWRPGFIESSDAGNFTGGLDFYTNGVGSANKIGALLGMRIRNANVFKPGGGPFGSTSDITLKKNIKPLSGSLNKLLKLRGVSYEWKEPEKQGNLTGKQMGMIAQEVEEVFPEWVGTEPDGMKYLVIRGFEALTVEALRELNEENENLKTKVKDLETKFKALEKKLKAGE